MVETFASLGLPPGFQELLDRRLAQTCREATDNLEQVVERRVQECARLVHGQLLRGQTALQKELATLQATVQDIRVGHGENSYAVAALNQRERDDLARLAETLRAEVAAVLEESLQQRVRETRSDQTALIESARRSTRDELAHARGVIFNSVYDQVECALVAFRRELKAEFVASAGEAQHHRDKRCEELNPSAEAVDSRLEARFAAQRESMSETAATISREQRECQLEVSRVEKLVLERTSELNQASSIAQAEIRGLQKGFRALEERAQHEHCQLDAAWSARLQNFATALQHMETQVANQKAMSEIVGTDVMRDFQRRLREIEGSLLANLEKRVSELARDVSDVRNGLGKLSEGSGEQGKHLAMELQACLTESRDSKLRLSSLESCVRECTEEQATIKPRMQHAERQRLDSESQLRFDLDAKLATMSSRFADSRDTAEMYARRCVLTQSELAEQQQQQLAIRIDSSARSIHAECKELAVQGDAREVQRLNDHKITLQQIAELLAWRAQQEKADSSLRDGHTERVDRLSQQLAETAHRFVAMEDAVVGLKIKVADTERGVEERLVDLRRRLSEQDVDLQQICAAAARRADEASARSVVLQSEVSAAELSLEATMHQEMRELQAEAAAHLEASQELRECRAAVPQVQDAPIARQDSARAEQRWQDADLSALEQRVHQLGFALSSLEVGSAAEHTALEQRVVELNRVVSRLEQPRIEPAASRSPARSSRLREELLDEVARVDERFAFRLRGELSSDIRRIDGHLAKQDEQLVCLRRQQQDLQRFWQQANPEDFLSMHRDVVVDVQRLDERLAAVDEQMLFLRGEVTPDAVCGTLERGGYMRRVAQDIVGEQVDRYCRRWCGEVQWQLERLAKCLQTLHVKAGLTPPAVLQEILQPQP